MPQAIVVPNSDPIAAVAAIAIAPQKVTRKMALPIGAPPAFAPTAPRMARNKSAAIDTVQLSVAAGDKGTIANGSAAPMANDPAEAKAACTGRAALCGQ